MKREFQISTIDGPFHYFIGGHAIHSHVEHFRILGRQCDAA